ncbi:MAG: hypothetical protein QNJ46_23365 [Leptolyngbyaceae cyanobacterium MO_188.B28]|nr:hypothetical protein [Leptolyngbyaceae cyanobacterium MO_188.B28]
MSLRSLIGITSRRCSDAIRYRQSLREQKDEIIFDDRKQGDFSKIGATIITAENPCTPKITEFETTISPEKGIFLFG